MCDDESGGLAVLSQTSTTIVANTNSKVKSGTNTSGADSQLNPYGVVASTVLNHGNVVILSVPDGANYLDLFNEWVGSNPTVSPVVRVFGEVPHRVENPGSGSLAGQTFNWPYDYNSAFFNPSTAKEGTDWKPLNNIASGSHDITLSSTIVLDNGTSKRGASTTVNLRGCKRVMVLIDTACVTPTHSLVGGHFGS